MHKNHWVRTIKSFLCVNYYNKDSPVEANIAIIKELKRFLEEVSADIEKRKQFTLNEKAFTRDRVLTISRIAGFLINMPKRSLGIEIREFLSGLSGCAPVSKSAFSRTTH